MQNFWLDDTIFWVVKAVKYNLLLEKERSLFYEPVIRSKDEHILITELGNESQFVEQILQVFYAKNQTEFNNIVDPIRICTSCKSPLLIERNFCGKCGQKI